MLIKCPKCGAEYKLEEDVVSDSGLKMRCHACGEVFKAYKRDLRPEKKPEEEQNVDMLKMFERVSKATTNLFSEASGIAAPTKVRVIHSTRYKNTVNYFLVFFVLALMAGMLYLMRYDVVRLVPNAEKIYNKLGIESIYDGTGLQIINIKIDETVVGNMSKIKVSGVIANPTRYEMKVLPLKVVVYDAYGNTLLDTTHYLPQERTRPDYKLPFTVVIGNPTPEKKNIQITFADNL